MKWVNLLVWLAATLPLVPHLRSNARLLKIVWILVGFLPFVMEPIHGYMSAIVWNWPGYVRGIELTVLDVVALALYLSLPRDRNPHPLPFRIAFGFYFFAVLFSAIPAIVPLAALFYSWQLARMFLLYAVIVRACANPIVPNALLRGMGAGLILQAPVVLWQRFGLGTLHAGGIIGPQNELGILSHFVIFPFFALLLTGRGGRLPVAVFLAGVNVELLTTSRATIELAAVGYMLVFALSAMRGWTPRKTGILLTSIIAVAVITPVAVSAIAERGVSEIASSDSERVDLERAASLMLADHPLGVGADNFVLAANSEGYYQRAGVIWTNSSATVHNFYWLTVAESGYLGLAAVVIFLLAPLIVALRCGLRHTQDIRGDLLIGLGIALLIAYIHNFVEWIFVSYRVQYVFVMDVGLIAGLATQMGYWRLSSRSFASRTGSGPALTNPASPTAIKNQRTSPVRKPTGTLPTARSSRTWRW